MSAGLFALLDDVALLAKAAAASIDDVGAATARASAKATGVVVDDTAVTPRYVHGLAAERELPIVKRIAKGSLRNKLIIILPVALVLSQFLPWALTPILMLGGTYLSFEGAEKVWEKASGTSHAERAAAVDEEKIVVSAVRTDLILSAEIMVIALGEVADEPFLARAIILVIVAILITALVYGVVGLIVKMDDVGLSLAQRGDGAVAHLGRGLVAAMPKVLTTLSTVGVAAMLWVGGHIVLVGLDELGVHAPYSLVHHAEHAVHDATGALGGVLGWLTNTAGSALFGLLLGAVVVAVMHVVPRRGGKGH
ncbi:conserved membrane hypothetical protein [Nostocoides japonicum T1-X7]|uniref:ABC transporter n=1 Tax=Nostocoides japonicum T1-X7 TaxID=1194083 RepID=A0A077M2D3_9MICO|nr:DUF808 domain-containing protein [Tetrasphaera japonica]CCH78390.1 conserved membrane hypothetical protein [Tetrasphaera japonica T1-X7]